MGKKIAIDGIFLSKKITGIQRYAIEITKEIDKINQDNIQFILVVPNWCEIPNEFNLTSIQIVRYGNHEGRMWEQIDLLKYLKIHDLKGLYFENTIPILYRHGYVVVHDVSLRANSNLFKNSLNNIMSIFWRRFLYRCIVYSKMPIITVSNFSKNEIQKYYDIDEDRIHIVRNAWQHINSIVETVNMVEKYPFLKEKKYFFALSTLAPNKNLNWILHAAKNNPNDMFVIAGGGKLKENIGDEYKKLKNIYFLGYVSDSDAKALMHNCKAFLFPSFYEGFGIPPMEALASGAPAIIVSDTPCMHEIYKDIASYINPYDYNIKIDFINKSKYEIKTFLDLYSWQSSAKNLYKLLVEV